MAEPTARRFSFCGCACCDETLTLAGAHLTRRNVLGGAAGLAFGSFAATRAKAQAPASAKIPIVDVHHHLAPPAFIADLKKRGSDERKLMEWTPEKSLADMDGAGVATAMLSITEPGIWFGDDDAAVTLAHACNEYGAKLVADGGGRFGLFAVLPLPSVEGSLREIAYAFDTLKADGVGLMTSYGDKWLGDSAFAPVMDELNRRKAVVYTHPIQPACCRNLIAEVPRSVVEFGTDTTRTIASLLFTGTASRCPDIKFIFSHAGGTMPFSDRTLRPPAKIQQGGGRQGPRRRHAAAAQVLLRHRADRQSGGDGGADQGRADIANRLWNGFSLPYLGRPRRRSEKNLRRSRSAQDRKRQRSRIAAASRSGIGPVITSLTQPRPKPRPCAS